MSAPEAYVTRIAGHAATAQPTGNPAVPASAWGRRQVGLALILGALLTAAVGAQAALGWYQERAHGYSPGPVGGWYSVQLVNGQVYYGVLAAAGNGYVRLNEVYYIQSYQQPNGQPGNRVVNRQKNDWHGPASQTIPSDKIMFMEALGPQSQLARLIRQDKAGAPQ
jgi:hypothetical protein